MISLKLFFSWSYFFLLLFYYYLYHRWVAPNDKWSFFFLFFTCSSRLFKNKPPAEGEDDDPTQAGVNKASKGGIIYGDYLQVEHVLQDLFSINLFLFIVPYISVFCIPFFTFQLEKILSSQVLQSEVKGRKIHDEHLFVVTHQGKAANFQNFQWKKSLASRIKKKLKNSMPTRKNTLISFLYCDMYKAKYKSDFFFLPVTSPSELELVKLVYHCSLRTLVQTDFVWAGFSARDLHQWTRMLCFSLRFCDVVLLFVSLIDSLRY